LKISKYRGDDREKLLVKIAYRYGALGVSKFAKAIERITDMEEKGKIYHLACEAENYINKDIKDDIEQEEMILVKCAFKLGALGRKPDVLIEQEPDPRTRGFFRNYINKVLLYLDAGHDREEIEFAPSHVICPACGSNKVRVRSQYIGTEVTFTGVCRECKRELGSEEPPIKSDYYSKEEFEKFQKEIGEFDFHEDKQYWALFLFKKKDGGKISFDLSPKNLARCEENYCRYPKDRNTLFAQLMVCVLTDRPWKDLAMDFFQPLPGSSSERAWYVYCFFLGTHRPRNIAAGDWCRSRHLILTSVQKQRLKKFFLWFIDTYPSLFREITKEDIADYEVFGPMSDIIGSKNIARLIDPIELMQRTLSDGFSEGEDGNMPLVVAEAAFQDEKWGLALFIYQKVLASIEHGYNLDGKDVIRDFRSIGFHKDIFKRPLKYKDLKARVDHCLVKISEDPSGRCFHEYSSLVTRHYMDTVKEQAYERKMRLENEREIEEYQKVHPLTEKDAELAPYLILREFEGNMREMLERVLTKVYGSKVRAWSEGVSLKIRQTVAVRAEEDDPLRKNKGWDFLDITDYYDIACKNWACFESIFEVDKKGSKDALAGFIKELNPMRKIVMHHRGELSDKQVQRLKEIKKLFDAIYEKSKR